MADIALRKKKNADAQAAFRTRRAHYIATLEETVTSLESIVIQLQVSCRESRTEAIELRQENNRLLTEQREHERLWRALCHAKKSGQAPEVDSITPPPPPLLPPLLRYAQVATVPSHPSASLALQQHSNVLGYSDDSVICRGPYNGPSGRDPPNFSDQSSPAPFPNNEVSGNGLSGLSVNFCGSSYLPYSYPIPRDGCSQVASTVPPGVGAGEPITPPHSQSPVSTDFPSLTSAKMPAYPGGFSAEEQKMALNSVLHTAPYVFPNWDRFNRNLGDGVPNSCSMSPKASTNSSTTSLLLTPSSQFTFHDAPPGQECTGFDYRRQSLSHCPVVILHGGTADVPLTDQSSDAVQYHYGRRPPDLSADHWQSILGTNESAQHDQGDGDVPFNVQRVQSRRDTIPSPSRSPSPGLASISYTVSVIRSQAFGTLRGTRARTKTSEGVAKVVMDILEARGIQTGGVSTGSKRPRMDDEVMEAETL